jgi:hypothetical protein
MQSPNLTFKKLRNQFSQLCSLAGHYDNNPICCTGHPGYVGWRNRYLGFLNVYNVYNSGSEKKRQRTRVGNFRQNNYSAEDGIDVTNG